MLGGFKMPERRFAASGGGVRSSILKTGPAGHAAATPVASNVPRCLDSLTGGLKRRSQIGGSANGMPLKVSTVSLAVPRMVPDEMVTDTGLAASFAAAEGAGAAATSGNRPADKMANFMASYIEWKPIEMFGFCLCLELCDCYRHEGMNALL
jgi:hypothetical protein